MNKKKRIYRRQGTGEDGNDKMLWGGKRCTEGGPSAQKKADYGREEKKGGGETRED